MSQSKEPARPAWWKRAPARYLLAGGCVTAAVVVGSLAIKQRAGGAGGSKQTPEERLFVVDHAAYGGRCELDPDDHVVKLAFDSKKFGDDAVAEVHTLPYLKRLNLQKSAVTDLGVAEVAKCRRLEALNLMNTKVTDAGLAHLQRTPSLLSLWVTESDTLTSRGIERLRRALPTIKITVGPKAADGKAQAKGALPTSK